MKKNIFIISILLIAGFFIFNSDVYAESETEITFGSEYEFNTASTSSITLTNLSSSKFVVAYQDDSGNLDYGKVLVGNISGDEISYGSEYTFNDGITDYISIASLSESRFVIAYRDKGYLNYGAIIIGDVSGNEISFGSEYAFNSAFTNEVSVTSLSQSKFVVVYRDTKDGSARGKAVIGEVSGNAISFGSEYVFNTAGVGNVSVKALSENKFAVIYQDVSGSNQGIIIIGTVSGTSISFGSEYIFNPSNTADISAAILSSSKIAIAYKDQGGNNYGTIIIGDISNSSISFGSEYVFNPAMTNYVSIGSFSENKIVVSYRDSGNSNYGQSTIGDISEDEITYGSEYVFQTSAVGITLSQPVSESKFVVVYQDRFNYGKSVIGSIPVSEPEPESEPEPQPQPSDAGGQAEPQPTPEAPAGEAEPETTVVDGTLIRNPNATDMAQFDIYIVKIIGDKKFRRLILSPYVFESYGHLNWEDVKDVSQVIMDAYTSSDLVRAAGDDRVYKLNPSGDTGTKQWLNITAGEFAEQEYDSDSIYEINETDRDAYITGADITS